MIEPQKWASTLGSQSDTVTLPDEDLQFASFKKLFPALTQVPLSEGGVAPQRTDFNTLFKLLGDNIFYLQQGGVFSYSDTADYERGAFVKYNNELYLCIQDNSSSNKHAPTDAEYWKKIALNSNVVTGTLLPFAGSDIPTGYLLCNGAEVLKDDYSELYSVIGDIYGTASSTDKFKLPDFRDRFMQGANGNLGVYLDAGLPNITGRISILESSSTFHCRTVGEGAFYSEELSYWSFSASGSNIHGHATHFDAARSSSVYGKSSTVQPPALAVNILIKY